MAGQQQGGFASLYPRPDGGGMVEIPIQQQQHQSVPDLYPTYATAPAAPCALAASPAAMQARTPEVSQHGAGPDPYFKNEGKWDGAAGAAGGGAAAGGAAPFLTGAYRPPSKFGSFRQSGSFHRPSAAENGGGNGGMDPAAGGAAGNGSNGTQQEAPPKYQDAWAGLLFLAHLVVIFWCAFDLGLPVLRKDVTASENADGSTVNIANDSIVSLASGGVVCTLAAAAFSFIWLKVGYANDAK